jgi:methylated-DNA-[protein]-cysteine S-methyltransferase
MLIVIDERGNLRALDWTGYEERMQRLLRRHFGKRNVILESGMAPETIRQPLERYLTGELGALDSIPVQTNGTEFQRLVWDELRRIPAGSTTTYAEIARRIGRPKAVRAVGAANGANPVGVVVPCHRVIGANGSLTGFGGGIERKRWLLEHEGALRRE